MHIRNRPDSLDGVVGNNHIKTVLTNRIANDDFGPLLFIGPKGTGKTTFALIMAKEFGAHQENIRHINCVNFEGISEMRKLVETFDKSSIFGKKKVFIFDEIHKLSDKAQQDLLVPIEQEKYLGKILFIACTTTLRNVVDTLMDRFTDLQPEQLSDEDTKILIDRICEKEQVSLDVYTKKLIIEKSEGFPRVIIKSISKVAGVTDQKEVERLIEISRIEEDEDILLLMKMIIAKKSWNKVKAYLSTLLKTKSTEAIRVGLMNLIAYRLTSNFLGPEENGEVLTYMFERLRVANNFPEKANLTVEIFNIQRLSRNLDRKRYKQRTF